MLCIAAEQVLFFSSNSSKSSTALENHNILQSQPEPSELCSSAVVLSQWLRQLQYTQKQPLLSPLRLTAAVHIFLVCTEKHLKTRAVSREALKPIYSLTQRSSSL